MIDLHFSLRSSYPVPLTATGVPYTITALISVTEQLQEALPDKVGNPDAPVKQ